jgi:hypothetical protein
MSMQAYMLLLLIFHRLAELDIPCVICPADNGAMKAKPVYFFQLLDMVYAAGRNDIGV